VACVRSVSYSFWRWDGGRAVGELPTELAQVRTAFLLTDHTARCARMLLGRTKSSRARTAPIAASSSNAVWCRTLWGPAVTSCFVCDPFAMEENGQKDRIHWRSGRRLVKMRRPRLLPTQLCSSGSTSSAT
jgi:hypothetical protein